MKYLVFDRKTVTLDEVIAAAEKAGLLGELAQRMPRKGHRTPRDPDWTVDEDADLQRIIQSVSDIGLAAKLLHRSEDAVFASCVRLGIVSVKAPE